MRKNGSRWAITSTTLIISIVILSSCEKPATPPPQPVAVSVTEAAVKDVPVTFKTFGSVIPYQMVAVKAMVSSQLVKVAVKDGQYVKTGDLLFELDKQPFEAVLRQAEANLTKDQAQSKFAQSEEKRIAELSKEKISSQADYDQAKANADALLAAIKADEAAIENAKVPLGYCTIKSPIDGRIGAVMINLGNLIKANDTVALVTINQVKPIFVSFFVPEGRLLEIKKYQTAEGLPVEAVIAADPTHPEQGRLSFINNQVDNTTGMIELRATFDNTGERLWPGLYVNVTVALTTMSQVVVLPNRGVQTGQTDKFVFVLKDDNTVEMRTVTTGLITDTDTVITSGLKAGERVVTDGQMKLKDGAKVVLQAPGAGNTASGTSAASGRESRAGEPEKVDTATTAKTATAASAEKAEAAKGGAGQ